MQLDNFSEPVSLREQKTAAPGARRLIVAIVLGIAAVGGLTLAERFRDRVPAPTPSHEPAQALITTVMPVTDQVAAGLPSPPPPSEPRNDEKLEPAAAASAPGVTEGKPSATRVATDTPYMVHLGVFQTTSNAQALQKQLKRAGIDAHLETFVKVGPFKDKRDAERALARAKKIGVKAVLVGPPVN